MFAASGVEWGIKYLKTEKYLTVLFILFPTLTFNSVICCEYWMLKRNISFREKNVTFPSLCGHILTFWYSEKFPYPDLLISWPIFSSVDTADIWFPTPPGTPAMSTRASSRTASIHSSSRPSSVASYVSFQRSNNPQPRCQESPYKSGQRHMVRARLHADG